MSDEKKRINELEKQIRHLQRENDRLAIRGAILTEAYALGVATSALDDVQNRSERHFQRTDGKIISTDGMLPREWIESLKKTAPHYWPESNLSTDNKPPEEKRELPAEFKGSSNPWSKDGWNITKQGQVFRDHGEAVANRLATLAGVTVDALKPKG